MLVFVSYLGYSVAEVALRLPFSIFLKMTAIESIIANNWAQRSRSRFNHLPGFYNPQINPAWVADF